MAHLCHLQILCPHRPTPLQMLALDGFLLKRPNAHRYNPHQVQVSAQPDWASREYGIAETCRQHLGQTRLNLFPPQFPFRLRALASWCRKRVRSNCYPPIPKLCSYRCQQLTGRLFKVSCHFHTLRECLG
jgi:hypothetical protein